MSRLHERITLFILDFGLFRRNDDKVDATHLVDGFYTIFRGPKARTATRTHRSC